MVFLCTKKAVIEGRACGLHVVDWGWGRYNRRLSYDDSNPQVSYGFVVFSSGKGSRMSTGTIFSWPRLGRVLAASGTRLDRFLDASWPLHLRLHRYMHGVSLVEHG